MRAAYVDSPGLVDSIKVGDLPEPNAGPGEVLVKVGATSFNPIDLYLRSGMVAMPLPYPYILGCDLAGTVAALGEGATRFQVGDRVWGSNQGMLGRQGTTAEFAAVGESWLAPTPRQLSDGEAAALALVGITAHLGLFRHGKLAAGETVYVPGGGGGVGSMVVQMAKAAGARVATSAGKPASIELCQSLGADLVLNYKTDDLTARLREFAPQGVDLWYETRREPDLEVSIPLLRPRGRMILIAGRTARPPFPVGPFYTRDCSVLGFAMFNATPDEQRPCTEAIHRWVEAGSLRAIVGRTFPIAETAAAQRLLEETTLEGAGTLTGKVVVEVV